MASMNASELRTRWGETIDLALSEPVVISRHGRPSVVVLSVKEFERLRDAAERAAPSPTEPVPANA